MGQGYHSKVIFGMLLTEAQSKILENLSPQQSDHISRYFGKYGVSQSYNVRPPWFGVAFAATDELVARMNKITDFSGGIEIGQIVESCELSKVQAAQKAMGKIAVYLTKFDLQIKSPEFLLVTDYH